MVETRDTDPDGSTPLRQRYFSRCATWHKLTEEQITVHDSFSDKAPRVITMDPWPQLVFLAADGQHTVEELVRKLAAGYDAEPPGLEEQVLGLVETLVAEGIVRLSDTPMISPPYFAEDHSAASPEVRAAQMRADGLIE